MDLSVTNTWLAVGAVSLSIIAICVVAVLIAVLRSVRHVAESTARMTAAIELVSQHVTPLAVQTSAVLDDMHQLAQQLRHTDAMATEAVGRIANRWRQISTVARSGLWPAIAVARSAAAVVGWISNRKSARQTAEDTAAEERFTYEGGGHVRTGAGR